MPEITVTDIAALALVLIVGLVLGWAFRSKRSREEEAGIHAGWQEQFDAMRNQRDRLAEHNSNLLEQNRRQEAECREANIRTSELSSALREAFSRHSELQHQIKAVREALGSAVTVSAESRGEAPATDGGDTSAPAWSQAHAETIARLSLELERWQQRVPPLIDRFRERNEQARRLQAELDTARARLRDLESGPELTNASHGADDLPALLSGSSTRDNLKLIKGVGPAIEKTLNELGICRYNQIIDMSEGEIDRVAKRLKGFRSRIYREDWMGQARDLRERKTAGQR